MTQSGGDFDSASQVGSHVSFPQWEAGSAVGEFVLLFVCMFWCLFIDFSVFQDQSCRQCKSGRCPLLGMQASSSDL